MGQFNEEKSYEEMFSSIHKKWKQILLDEGVKLRLQELVKIARNYPNYIVSLRREGGYGIDLGITNTCYLDNYSNIFTLTNNLYDVEGVALAYTLMELEMTGKLRKIPIPIGFLFSMAVALRSYPPPSNAYLIDYYMVKDPAKPARLICKYRKKLYRGRGKYWGDTLVYEWDPGTYVPEAIERLRKRSYELCSTIPTCKFAMLDKPKSSNPFDMMSFTQLVKLMDSNFYIKESWLR